MTKKYDADHLCGGYKQSGLGRENGLQAIEHYTQVKTVYANLGNVGVTY